MQFYSAFGFILLGYICGSFPFAVWVTRWRKGTDVRDAGSRHATATNTIRQAGWFAGVIVLLLDIAKGFLPVYLARQFGMSGWQLAFIAAAVVVGHCWPLFAGFRGGMGLACAGGAILAVDPLSFLIGVGFLILVVLLIHHSARASVLVGALLPWLYWIIGIREESFWVALGAGLVVALRFLIDWNRRYRELWLDRPGS
jgi:glycerol-3-phosphate acyltransferase PlsY